MNILKRSGHREEATSIMEAKSAKKMRELLDMTDEELKLHGSPPPFVQAQFTDGDGNVYRGTLLLTECAKEEDA